MVHVNSKRMLSEINLFANISSTIPGEGITRISWTKEYAQGTDYLKQKMHECGMEVWEDRMGNICGCLKGENPQGSILSGSHFDTVLYSGAYDGVMGIISALETARLLKENHVKLRNNYKVLAMVEEEGTRTGNVLAGSNYIRDCWQNKSEKLPSMSTKEGEQLSQSIAEYKKLQQYKVEERPILEQESMIFVEVHDEQGPVLEQASMEVGIVENIRGIINFEVTLTGSSGHPGTVPMSIRRDCSLAAYAVCLKMSRFVEEHYNDAATITFGKMEISPGSGNSIPGKAVFSVDIRFQELTIGEIIEQKVIELLKDVQEETGLDIKYESHVRKMPVRLDERIRSMISCVCDRCEKRVIRIDSGAGHDAMNFAQICPTVMIFSPCKNGVSHNKEEYVSEKDMRNVTEILYETIIELDKEIGQ